ncbi:IPT/TIG domain-containing protein [Micromonospora pisi]|uniref:IPT/TIG domain-containing protein n=1 Tax=Micromonospora pisi TaxID=589240 RepID=A0A495JBT8_9ACTN|nr:IPT/TIG domain-containing protein [Micromonospora pisi]RKR86273.1 IPT/TIG domain-containing protein [Micromonospora pisi]
MILKRGEDVRPIWQTTSAAALALAVAGVATVGTASPALAAPGDASATAVVVDLDADVSGDPLVAANATIGNVTAPPGGGTDSDTALAISLPGALNVVASGTASVSATRDPGISSASSEIENFSLSIMGVTVLTADAIAAQVTCPAVGAQTADTQLTDAELLGAPVIPPPYPNFGYAGIVVPGLIHAVLDVDLDKVETVNASGATTTAILLRVRISGDVSPDVAYFANVGTVTLARASCERAVAAPAPTATAIDPDSGPQSGGQQVTITGTNFVPADTTVTFDGVAATNVVIAPGGTSLTATAPVGAVGPASVVVGTTSGAAAPLTYTYLADGSDATVTNLVPPSGPTSGGTLVTLTGTGFQGATGVTFDGIPGTGFTLNPAATTITVSTPPNGAGPATVNLVFPAGTTAAPNFTYLLAAPLIAAIAPDQGPTSGGTTVTVTGSGFVPGQTTVTICNRTVSGGAVAVNPNGLSLTFIAPACAKGDATVTVTTPAGTSNGVTFRYVYAGLPVTGVPAGTLFAIAVTLIGAGAIALTLMRRRSRLLFTV